MNSLEKMILQELSSLSNSQQIDVLGFIRFLKSEKPEAPEWIREWFENALKQIHQQDSGFTDRDADISANRS